MDDLQTRMGAILNDPEMMQKISAMAQSLGAGQPNPQPAAPEAPAMPDIDPGLIQKIAGFANQIGVDNNQKTLLQALNPYLTPGRINKLERAMRAASMAKIALVFLGRQQNV